MRISISDRITNRIRMLPEGDVITIADFSDVANAKTVSKTLERICSTLGLSKIARGIFWKPKGEHPEPITLANAIARENGWTIAPCGETAKHCFGLAERPKKWTFVTTGTYRDYHFGDYTISFYHTTGKMIRKISAKTALLVEVLKACGRSCVPEKLREKVATYSKAEKEKIISDTKFVTVWISGEIKKLLGNRT